MARCCVSLLTRENSSTADAVHEDDCQQGTKGLWRKMMNGNAENKIHLSAAMMAFSHSFFCHMTAKESHVYCAAMLISAGFFCKNK